MALIDRQQLYRLLDFDNYYAAKRLYETQQVSHFQLVKRTSSTADMKARVRDNGSDYEVQTSIDMNEGRVTSFCRCKAFQKYTICCHVGAVLFQYIEEAERIEENDRKIRWLLGAYMPRKPEATEPGTVRLAPLLTMPDHTGEHPVL